MTLNGSITPSTQAPARIAWLVPAMIEGSGGIRTMLQNADALIRRGHRCDIYVDHNLRPGESQTAADRAARDRVRACFGYDRPGIFAGFELRGAYDLVFATAWWTARIVADLPDPVKRAYFVQDFEAWFNPMGDGFLMGENSYRLGLTPITIGRWLTRKLAHDYGCNPAWFDFGADHAVYRPLGARRERAVCFIHQPEKPRRCPRLGLMALEVLRRRRPDVKLYLYGSTQDPHRLGCTHLGLLGVEACNELYNRCTVGLCISSSNPSRIPFEMMAAGTPVVDIHRENNLYDMPQDAIVLADPTPEALAQTLIDVLDNPARAEAMSRAGVEFMRQRTLEHGYEQFVTAVEDILQDLTSHWPARAAEIEAIYSHAPVTRPDRAEAPTALENPGLDENREIDAARTTVDLIERSRSWRLLQALKKSGAYRAWANARFGPGWDRVDPAEDPRARLARIRASRAFKLIDSMKQNGVYRFYARRGSPQIPQPAPRALPVEGERP